MGELNEILSFQVPELVLDPEEVREFPFLYK